MIELLSTDRVVYQDGTMALLHGDCRQMSELKSGSIDLVFADPPFNLGRGRFNYGAETDEAMPPEEYGRWTGEWMLEARRVLKRGGHLFALMVEKWMKYWLPYAPDPFHFLPWCKTMSSYLGDERTFNRASELIFWHWKGGKIKTFNKSHTFDGDKDWVMGPIAVGEVERQRGRKGHPAPRPTWLYEHFISKCSQPGDIVLDPFLGSGTGGVAARKLGRRFIGYDTNREYVEAARAHLCQQGFSLEFYGQIQLEIPDQEEMSVR